MSANVSSWKKLFYFCLGLFLASAFCMKWMEPEFISRGKMFSIMDLELYLGKDELQQLLLNLDDKTSTIVNYHLHFDFLFMAGVFPGIACLCMLTRARIQKERRSIRSILFVMASLQLFAWSFDIYENTHLLKWLKHPDLIDNIGLYHALVRSKFVLAFSGVIIAGLAFLTSLKKTRSKILAEI